MEFSLDTWLAFAKAHGHEYRAALPFPHIVIDGFFPDCVLEQVLAEFPIPEASTWIRFNRGYQKKLISGGDTHLGANTRCFLNDLRASGFITFLEQLTGIDGIIPDPHIGGAHQVLRDGYLNIHADGNRDNRMNLDRRLNVFIYLNKHWKDEYKGHLELWDSTMSHCHKKVLPTFNRTVIFNISDSNYHGQPDPLACPEGWSRKALALNYSSNSRPYYDIGLPHRLQFRRRPGDPIRFSWHVVLNRCMPPVVLDVAKWVQNKFVR